MYLLLDKENLKFRYKHPDNNLLMELAWIECSQCACAVFHESDTAALSRLTTLELRLLLEHTTGTKPPVMGPADLVQMCHRVALSLPSDTLKAMEVLAQSAWVKANDAKPYKFIPGAVRPALVEGIFNYPAKTFSGTLRDAVAPIPPAPAPHPVEPVASCAPMQPPVPAAGSVTERIFTACDAALATLGNGDAKSARKVAIVQLVEAGVNANSAGKGSLMWLKNHS